MRRALALTVLLLVPATARADVGGPEIVAHLNAQRTAHGLPAGIVEDPALSSACAQHNAYGATNGELTHEEDPAAPGYTQAGADAAASAVLYQGGDPWTARNNPFETAPIHLAQLLAPRLDRMGAAESSGYGCATTLASRDRPAPVTDAGYSYPGDGSVAWPTGYVAAESPYTPGEQVGLPAGTRTGPYLYVFFDGPDLDPGSVVGAGAATLRGPDGPVAVKVTDNTTPGLEAYMPPGVIVIPERPLRDWSTYRALVSGSAGGRPFSHAFRFETAGKGRPFTAKRVRGGVQLVTRIRLEVQVRRGRKVLRTVRVTGRRTVPVPRRGKLVVRGGGATFRLSR